MKDIKVGFCSRSLIIIQVKETAGCDGDYLQFGRDKFIITDRLSPKFCNKVILKKKIPKKSPRQNNPGAGPNHARR